MRTTTTLFAFVFWGCLGDASLLSPDGGTQTGTGGGTVTGTGGGLSGSGGGATNTGGGNASGGAATGGGSSSAGLASQYAKDVGIENNPDVIWAEHFNAASVNAVASRYTQAQNTAGMALVNDTPAGAGDPNSLRVTATASVNSGSLYRYFSTGYDEVYVRYYIKYVDTQYHHTTVNIGGVNPAAQPSITSGAVGLCCTAPDGDKALSVSLEPRGKSGSAYIIDFYNYWLEMKSWGDIVNPPAPANEPDPITGALKKPAAGNGFLIGSEPRFDFNRWYAVELHIKLNTPSAHDGVLGLWVDGQSVIELGPGYPKGSYTGTNFGPNAAGQPFEGLRYRDNAVLKINHIWITNYATQLSSGQTAAVYYDQLVVAKRYIGPLHP